MQPSFIMAANASEMGPMLSCWMILVMEENLGLKAFLGGRGGVGAERSLSTSNLQWKISQVG